MEAIFNQLTAIECKRIHLVHYTHVQDNWQTQQNSLNQRFVWVNVQNKNVKIRGNIHGDDNGLRRRWQWKKKIIINIQ